MQDESKAIEWPRGVKMKQWYKVLNVNGVDGKVDGFSFIEANSAEEAEELTYQDWQRSSQGYGLGTVCRG